MCVLAILKLQNLESFSSMFLIGGADVAVGAGGADDRQHRRGVGVQGDKRELKCACVGGDSKVPLGFVSLTENVMMVAMAVWMVAAPM